MQYFNKINIENIISIILKKSSYQKVLILYDTTTNISFLSQLEKELKGKAVLFSVNFDVVKNRQVEELIANGVRTVVCVLKEENFIRLSSFYDFNLTSIDITRGELIFSHLKNKSEYYLYCPKENLDFADELMLANILMERKWSNLIASKNYEMKTTYLFTDCVNLDLFFDCEIVSEFFGLKREEYDLYLYFRLLAIKYLFMSFCCSSQQMVDVYKEYQENLNNVNYVYKLYTEERVNFLLKNCSELMLGFITELVENFKHKFVSSKIERVEVVKHLKQNAKQLQRDGLLKYAFLYGIFDKV